MSDFRPGGESGWGSAWKGSDPNRAPKRPLRPIVIAGSALLLLAGLTSGLVVATTSSSRAGKARVSGATTSIPSTSTTPATAPASVMPATTVPATTIPATPTSVAVAPPVPGPTGGSLVTRAIEQQVIATTWKRFATAFATGDTATIAATATPEVQQAVVGTFHCGCGGWPTASTVVNYSAPIQRSYPLFLFAELQGQDFNSQPLRKEVAFSQSGPGRPWLVAYLGDYVDGSPVFGTASSTSVNGRPYDVAEPLSAAPGQFSAWFQQLDESGITPPLPAHWEETPVMSQIADGSAQGYASDQAEGYSDSWSHSIASMSPAFGIPGGQVIFADLRVHRVVTGSASQPIVQPADRSTWGQLLVPGTYHRLVFEETIDICLGESTTGTITQITNLGGAYSVTGS